jgi:hypothetical protein
VAAVVGLVAAFCAAVSNSAAGLLEAAGGRRAAGARRLLSQPLYLVGLGVDVLGFALTVLALRYLPVFAVQAVLAGSIAITALAAHRLYAQPLHRADRLAIAACVGGLTVVAASAGTDAEPTARVGIILLGTSLVLAAVAVPVWRAARPVPCAVVAGLGFGGVALAVRALHLSPTLAEDLTTLPVEPSAYAFAVFAALGVATYTRALTHGEVATVTGVLVVTEAVVPGLAGVVLLGDTVRPGWAWACAVGLLLAVGGAAVLSRSDVTRPAPASRGHQRPAPD